jgi:hypothetical protein
MNDTSAPTKTRRRWDLIGIDVCFLLIGIGGMIGSVPALQELLPHGFVAALCLALVVLGLAALVGVYADLWLVELVSKLFIGGGLAAYLATLVIVIFIFPEPAIGTSPGAGRLYVVGGVGIPIIVIASRLPDLIRRAAKAKAQKQALAR